MRQDSIMNDKVFELNCSLNELLTKDRSSFLYDKDTTPLALLISEKDNAGCYLTYFKDLRDKDDNRFQLTFFSDNEEKILKDYIKIDDVVLTIKTILKEYMNRALDIFISNFKQGKYENLDYYKYLGGSLFKKTNIQHER